MKTVNQIQVRLIKVVYVIQVVSSIPGFVDIIVRVTYPFSFSIHWPFGFYVWDIYIINHSILILVKYYIVYTPV